VRVAALDQRFLRRFHVLEVDGDGAVGEVFEGDLLGEGIDQPGLAAGQLPGPGFGLGGERLAGLRRVLVVERGDFLGGEVLPVCRGA